MAGAFDTAWQRHRFTVDEVERMVATGVLGEDAHVELLDGDLVEVSPQGPVHAALHTDLRERLAAAYAGRGHVRNQCPLRAGPIDLPEPDLAVVRGVPRDWLDQHPRGSDALLVVEVALTSQVLDQKKAGIYAAGGVAVYWLLDVEQRTLTEHGEPTPQGFGRRRVLADSDEVALPGLSVRWRVDDLF